MNCVSCIVFGIFALIPSVTLVLAVIFGAFEDRSAQHYRFRLTTFLLAVAALFVAETLYAFPIVAQMRALLIEDVKRAEAALNRSRAAREYVLDTLSTTFPELLDARKRACYRSALSNYVEDQWNRSFHDEIVAQNSLFCKTHPTVCVSKQDDYYEAVRRVANPDRTLSKDFATMGLFVASDWLAAKGSYTTMRRLLQQRDDKGNVPPAPDAPMLAEYQRYLAQCSSLHAPPWAVPRAPLLKSGLTFCVGRCS